MYTIQYQDVSGQHRTQEFSAPSRLRLTAHLANFNRPIVAVYEQASPITKTMRSHLQTWPGSLSREARDFAFATSPR
jgi:hypothetical protein